MKPEQRIIFTGGPGAGKSTVLHALSTPGISVVEESARAIIRERRNSGLVPRPDPRRFAEEVLRRDILNYEQTSSEPGLFFFDRSILDALCMLDQAVPLQQNKSRALLSRYPYRRLVFFFPPWEDIYRNDAERDQTFAQAEAVFDTLITWYRRCGYEVVQVPPGSISERCTFVLQMAGVGRT